MASAPSDSDYREVRERKRLETNTEIRRPEGVSQTNLNGKQLRNRAIPVSPPRISPGSSSEPIYRLIHIP